MRVMDGLARLLGLTSRNDPPPMDKIQLDAAQDRHAQRSVELEVATDQLGEMVRRMKRGAPTRRRKSE